MSSHAWSGTESLLTRHSLFETGETHRHWYTFDNTDPNCRATKASKALAMIRAKYRWCLTGTPVTNTLSVSIFISAHTRMTYLAIQRRHLWFTPIRPFQTLQVRVCVLWNSLYADFLLVIGTRLTVLLGRCSWATRPWLVRFTSQFLWYNTLIENNLGLRAQEVLKPLMIRRTKNSELVSLLSVSVARQL